MLFSLRLSLSFTQMRPPISPLVLLLVGVPVPGVQGDADGRASPAAADDGPHLPGLHPPGVDQQQLQVGALSQHPRVRGQQEVVLHGVKRPTPKLVRKRGIVIIVLVHC